ncbi:hypothetical protein ES708_07420 [subsurface metagenome]
MIKKCIVRIYQAIVGYFLNNSGGKLKWRERKEIKK